MLTNYGSQLILRGLTGQTNSAPLPVCYIGLSTTTPSADGSGFTEPSTEDGYARVLIGEYTSSASWAMDTPSGGETSNTALIVFPEPLNAWGTVTHFGLFDSPIGGNLVAFYALTAPVDIPTDFIPTFKPGQLTINLPDNYAIVTLNGNTLVIS